MVGEFKYEDDNDEQDQRQREVIWILALFVALVRALRPICSEYSQHTDSSPSKAPVDVWARPDSNFQLGLIATC